MQGKTSSVYSRSNAWRFTQELTELYPLCYLYHEGDVVYIGADKYEISDLGEDAVSLRNPEFPLFGTEMSRADFEEKLRENPMNDHLKTVITEKQETRSPAEGKENAEEKETEAPAEEKPDSITFSIGFSEHPAFYDKQFVLWGQLRILHEEREQRFMPEAQVFYLLTVVVLALLFPLWDKGAFGGEIVVVKPTASHFPSASPSIPPFMINSSMTAIPI